MDKQSIADYTEAEFFEFVKNIFYDDLSFYPTEKLKVSAVLLFEKLSEHPAGSDIIFYPEEGRDDTPEAVVKQVKEWRAANGKPGFKQP